MSTTGWWEVNDESWIFSDLSSFISAKSGAGSPACRVPARAWVQRVSNGAKRKTAGPGMRAITRANFSGGCRIDQKIVPGRQLSERAKIWLDSSDLHPKAA